MPWSTVKGRQKARFESAVWYFHDVSIHIKMAACFLSTCPLGGSAWSLIYDLLLWKDSDTNHLQDFQCWRPWKVTLTALVWFKEGLTIRTVYHMLLKWFNNDTSNEMFVQHQCAQTLSGTCPFIKISYCFRPFDSLNCTAVNRNILYLEPIYSHTPTSQSVWEFLSNT